MAQTIGYVRVSSDKQTADNQRLAILDYCNKKDIKVDDWIEVIMSTKRSPAKRRIDELLDRLEEDDRLIVAELSRLARSVGQIAIIVDRLLKNRIRFFSIKRKIGDVVDKLYKTTHAYCALVSAPRRMSICPAVLLFRPMTRHIR